MTEFFLGWICGGILIVIIKLITIHNTLKEISNKETYDKKVFKLKEKDIDLEKVESTLEEARKSGMSLSPFGGMCPNCGVNFYYDGGRATCPRCGYRGQFIGDE